MTGGGGGEVAGAGLAEILGREAYLGEHHTEHRRPDPAEDVARPTGLVDCRGPALPHDEDGIDRVDQGLPVVDDQQGWRFDDDHVGQATGRLQYLRCPGDQLSTGAHERLQRQA